VPDLDNLSEAWIREMGHRALILEAHHTTLIEGTRLTLEQAERLLEGLPVPEADPDDTRELLNYRRAFDFVSEYLESSCSPSANISIATEAHSTRRSRVSEKAAWT
jgi:Fic family protein